MNILVNLDTPQFVSWLAGSQKISDDYMAKTFPTLARPILEASDGSRYIRIIRRGQTNRGGSAHAFIDRTTGDVLKPASWKAPAKHARGNIFDDKNGLGSMGQYGPAYLR